MRYQTILEKAARQSFTLADKPIKALRRHLLFVLWHPELYDNVNTDFRHFNVEKSKSHQGPA